MRHHLGHLRLAPDSPPRDLAALALFFSCKPQNTTDLLVALSHADHDRGWVVETHDALARIAGGGSRRMRLVECDRTTDPGGGIVISAIDEALSGAVRPGDMVCAGVVASRLGDAEVRVEPRIYRKVCANGAVVYAGTGDAVHAETEEIGEAIEHCFAPPAFAKARARLVKAAETPLLDPLELLRALALRVSELEVVRAREERDDTVFGWLNALTALARRQPEPARRLELERKAEELLQHALLLRPVRQGSRMAGASV